MFIAAEFAEKAYWLLAILPSAAIIALAVIGFLDRPPAPDPDVPRPDEHIPGDW